MISMLLKALALTSALATPLSFIDSEFDEEDKTLCFIDPVFDEDEIRVFNDITYGSALNRDTQEMEELMLDLYLPPKSDRRKKRPVVIQMHGGGFIGGDKQQGSQLEYAQALTQRGYVVASINYRLADVTDEDDEESLKSEFKDRVLDAVEDFRAAIRFARSYAERLRLDPDRIIASGNSAGAITALHLAYASDFQDEGESGNEGFSSNPNGVISIAGALKHQMKCIDSTPSDGECQLDTGYDPTDDIGTFEDQPPLIMIHGTRDTTVPYVNAQAVCDRAQEVGLCCEDITIPDGGHGPWDKIFNDYFTDITTSLYEKVTKGAEGPAGCEEI